MNADVRPRIWINPNRDRTTANWCSSPDDKPRFATSPGAALDEALAEVGHVPAVIIWGAGTGADLVLAPRVPSEKMLEAGAEAWTPGIAGDGIRTSWEAMIVAAELSDGTADGWQLIETFDDQPHGQANPVLIAAGTVVGEAWFRDPDGANDSWESGWWWAGTGPGEYASSPVDEINDTPTHWRPLPAPPP